MWQMVRFEVELSASVGRFPVGFGGQCHLFPDVRFSLLAKELSAKDIHKETLPVYGGKCFLRKAVHSWAEKRGKRFADVEEFVKDFYAASFDVQVNQWDKCINAGGGYVKK
jgi:hypothetical protein